MLEATVTINGVTLTEPEVISLRVAVSSMRMRLADPEAREGIGELLSDGYDRHLQRVEQLLVTIG